MKTPAVLALVFATMGCATSAFAQTCASPTVLSSGQNIASATTCGGDSTVTNFCGGVQPTGPSNVYSYTAGASVSGNVTVTPTGTFNAAIGVVFGGANCNAALSSNCAGVVDSAGDGSATPAESFALSNSAANGTTYYLIITSLSGTGADQCGTYSMAMGTLPVKLQSFQIN